MRQSTAAPTSLAPGERLAVLSNENLANAAAAQAVDFASSYGGPVPLSIVNNAGQALILQASADNGVTWQDVLDNDQQAVTVASGVTLVVEVSPSLLYRLY